MNSELKAVVLKSKPFGNNDLLLTLFSDKEGKISALAKGVRGGKRSVLYTQPFVYSDYVLYKGSSMYTVDQANVIEPFYKLRDSIDTLAIAQYLLELVEQLPREMVSGDEQQILKLLLNSVFLLTKNSDSDASLQRIKMVFELKFSAICGFSPDLSACCECGSTTPGFWFFNEGMRCPDCGALREGGHRISVSMQKAIAYILSSELAQAWKFNMSEDAFSYLTQITERYITYIFNKEFSSLGYYRSLRTATEPPEGT